MYKFDVISFVPYVITSKAALVTLPSLYNFTTCKKKTKVKAFNPSKAKIKQTAQK